MRFKFKSSTLPPPLSRSLARLSDERTKPSGLKPAIERLEGEARPSTSAVGELLRQCGAFKSLDDGKRVHDVAIRSGCDGDTFVGNLAVQMYGKCGRLDEARRAFAAIRRKNVFSFNIMIAALAHNGCVQEARDMFDGQSCCSLRDHITWNTMVAAYAHNGCPGPAFACFQLMDLEGVLCNEFSFVGVLDACDTLAKGRLVHGLVVDAGLDKHVKVASCLVGMYGRHGPVEKAKEVFDSVDQADVVLGTKMFLAYAENGQLHQARLFFERMPEKDAVSWTAIVVAYAQKKMWAEAKKMFDRMPNRDFIAWNSLIAANTQNGNCPGAVELFFLMDQDGMQPNGITLLSVLDACTALEDGETGRRIHDSVVDPEVLLNLPVKNALVNMYGRCGQAHRAKLVFDSIDQPDEISWTSMISAYALSGDLWQAKGLLDEMPRFNAMAWDTMLVAYAQAGHLQEARDMLSRMEQPYGVGWTALISAYAQAGHGEEALRLFKTGDLEGMRVDLVSLVSIVDACSCSASLAHGKLVHAEAVDRGLHWDVVLGTALVTMYGRCGQPSVAREVFDQVLLKNDITWNAMITAYSQNGRTDEVLEVLPVMNLEGMRLASIGFLGVLSACAHGGLLEKGHGYFVSMQADYGYVPTLDQFVCVIDLLGRAGRLQDAESLISEMPFEAHTIAWMSLLGSCKQQGDKDLGSRIAGKVLELNGESSATYALIEGLTAK